MTTEEAAALRAFLHGAGALKDATRSGFTPAGRPESAAEHSWRLALMALAIAPAGLDLARVLALAIVHDLAEAVAGDEPAPLQTDPAARGARERAGLATLLGPAPAAVRVRLAALWAEYAAGATPEARFVKALDKIETILTHAEGSNPPGFDYAFNLGYGRAATDAVPALAALRALADAETRARAGAAAAS